MALITNRLGEFENGQVYFEYTYDEADGETRSIRMVNQTSRPVIVTINDPRTGQTFNHTFPANSTTLRNVPRRVFYRLLESADCFNWGIRSL